MAKVVQVIYVERTTGAGTEKDPCRVVKELWTLDGKLICYADPIDEAGLKELPL